MTRNSEIKEIDIKNFTCYYFYDIISINDFILNNVLLDEKSYQNIIYDVACKTPYAVRPLCIIFNKLVEYIRKFEKTKYLALFQSKKYERIFNRARYVIMLKSNISYAYAHKYMKIQINSDDDLSLEKTLNIHNVVILFKSVFNENHNHYYYQVFLDNSDMRPGQKFTDFSKFDFDLKDKKYSKVVWKIQFVFQGKKFKGSKYPLKNLVSLPREKIQRYTL